MKLSALFAAALLLATPAVAADLTDAQKAQIDKIAADALKFSGAPSASIAVIADGKIAYVKAYGDAQLEPKRPATPAMRYAIGSVSKQLTAAAVLMLVEDGKLSLDEPIGRWFPKVTGADKITPRHLLSHTSGIADFWPQDYVMLPMTKDAAPDKVIAEWGAKPLVFTPGERYEYSNTGYMIAGRIVERVSGQSLEAFLRQRIWIPLGMTSVVNYDAGKLKAPPDALGYDRAARGPVRPALHEGYGWGLGAFQWAMTAEDLARWDLSLINRSLLKPASYEVFFERAPLNSGQKANYALGLTVATSRILSAPVHLADGTDQIQRTQASVGHSGEVSGFVSADTVYPQARAAVVVLTNQESGSPAGGIAAQIGAVIAPPITEIAPTPPPPPPSAAPSPPTIITARPRAADELALDDHVRRLLLSLQEGKPDRAYMSANLSGYFTPQVVRDFEDTLKPLPAPVVSPSGAPSTRGGMTFQRYTVRLGGGLMFISVYAWPDGRIEQFLLS